MCFRKIISLVLIPLFVISNIATADVVTFRQDNLSTYMISDLINDPEMMQAIDEVSAIGDRSIRDRVDEVHRAAVKNFITKLIAKYKAIAEASGKQIQEDALQRELAGKLDALELLDKIPANVKGLLLKELERQFQPGFLAGFTGKSLPKQQHGVNIKEMMDQAIAKHVNKKTQPTIVINGVKVFSIDGLVTDFKENLRAALKEEGLDEPKREEIVNKYALEIISHPGRSFGSMYIDSLYYNILSNPEITKNSEEVLAELVAHEKLHIDNPNMTEEEAHKKAPITNVINALRKRMVLIAQSGGDCAGLNAVVATATEELIKKGYIPIGVREGFQGLTSNDFYEKYLIHLDVAQAKRIRQRPSTELFSSREAPFKASDWYNQIIEANKQNPSEQRRLISNLEKIRKIENWSDLTKQEETALNNMLITLVEQSDKIDDKKLKKSKNIEKEINVTYGKFVNFMTHVDQHGGLIVTGGDDHCRIAQKTAEYGRLAVAVPKSIDNDAMTQMLGFYKTAKHFCGRFLLGAITGRGKSKVFIAEIMGRNAGWLALAAGSRASRVPEKVLKTLGKGSIEAGKKKAEFIKNTTMIIVPEKKISILGILKRAQEIYKKHGTINLSVSEGYKVDPADPLLPELRKKNPLIDDVWKKVDQGKIETDIHGHPKLEGATDFIVAILTTRWENADAKDLDVGLETSQVKHVILGYTGRGLNPGKYDVRMGNNLTRKAVDLLSEGKTGWMASYPDEGMHPYEVEPLAREVGRVLDDKDGNKYPKDIFTLSQEDEEAFIYNDLVMRGFRLRSNAELIGAGVVFEDEEGVAKHYPLRDFDVIPEETVLDFKTAVLLLREDMMSSSISANTHRRSSIFEVPDDNGLLTMVIANKNPEDFAQWSDVDKASWEKLRPKILALVPGQEKPIAEVVKEAQRIKREEGLVFIVVGSGYKFSKDDVDLMSLIKGDPYLLEKKKIFAKDSGENKFTVEYISHYIRAAMLKYAKEDFPGKSAVNCNPLGEMYTVTEPDKNEAEKIQLNFTVSRSNDLISQVEKATAEQETHRAIEPTKDVHMAKTVVIMNKSLTEDFLGPDGSVTRTMLEAKYKLMEQSLAKMFAKEAGIVKVDTEKKMQDEASNFISKGYKVIMLDNNSLTSDIADANIGEFGKDYCVINVKTPKDPKDKSVPFINLNAMAMMGVGVLGTDYRLFSLAYKVFSGEEPTKEIIEAFEKNILWVVEVLPRVVQLTGQMVDKSIIGRLFAAAA